MPPIHHSNAEASCDHRDIPTKAGTAVTLNVGNANSLITVIYTTPRHITRSQITRDHDCREADGSDRKIIPF